MFNFVNIIGLFDDTTKFAISKQGEKIKYLHELHVSFQREVDLVMKEHKGTIKEKRRESKVKEYCKVIVEFV